MRTMLLNATGENIILELRFENVILHWIWERNERFKKISLYKGMHCSDSKQVDCIIACTVVC